MISHWWDALLIASSGDHFNWPDAAVCVAFMALLAFVFWVLTR